MPETPELEARVAKMQKDLEQVKEYMRDSIHDKPEKYFTRVTDALSGFPACVTLWLEVDGQRSLIEIEEALTAAGKPVNHMTLWRAAKRLSKGRGLIYKTDVKGKSPIYSKKPWAEELCMDDFVREHFGVQ
jgi:hypothetical protein